MSKLDIMIIGPQGNTHVAGSLARATARMGLTVRSIDTGPAYQANRVLKALYWRIGKRRAVHMRRFSQGLVDLAASERPRLLIVVGQAPLDSVGLSSVRSQGVHCLHWSTDDPWNPNCFAGWYLRTLPQYDAVFTPRRSNMVDFQNLGCRNVVWLPFAYDPDLFARPPNDGRSGFVHDVVFVGGADRDRAEFFSEFIRHGGSPFLVGGFWHRWPAFRELSLGPQTADELTRITAAAKVNLCLVRRANRDGHVMRTFEIPAVGGLMIAEDTAEHRDLFGPEGECVLYFSSPAEAASKARWAIDHPEDRQRMAEAAHRRIRFEKHTYRDRLETMLTYAPSILEIVFGLDADLGVRR